MKDEVIENYFDSIIAQLGSTKSLRVLLREAFNLGKSVGHADGFRKGYQQGRDKENYIETEGGTKPEATSS